MQHASCPKAIEAHRRDPTSSNVSTDPSTIVCVADTHTAACDWVGNGMHYACLTSPVDIDAPRRVYDGMKSTRSAKLSPIKRTG